MTNLMAANCLTWSKREKVVKIGDTKKKSENYFLHFMALVFFFFFFNSRVFQIISCKGSFFYLCRYLVLPPN